MTEQEVLFYENTTGEWEDSTLGEHIEIINGFAFKSRDFLDEQTPSALPVIKIKNVASGEVTINDVQYHLYDECLERYIVEEGDVLLALTGNHPDANTQVVGEASISKLKQKLLLNQRIAKIKPKASIDNHFLYCFLKDDATHDFLASQSSGSANQANISKKDIENIPICLPSIPEQQVISSVLSSLDDKIDLLHRQNQTLEQMAEILFRQWFIEGACEDWEEVLITELFEVRDGTHDSPKPKENGKKLITSRHLKPNKIDFDNAYFISKEDYDNINKRSKVETGDILFSMIGTIGNIFLEQSLEIDYAIKNIGLFKTSQNNVWSYFTYLWLKSDYGREFIHEYRSGSTQEYISLGSLRNIRFYVESEGQVRNFNSRVEFLFRKIYLNQAQIHTLFALRDTLLPKLMNGEVRVIDN